jgi:hypothetical protein
MRSAECGINPVAAEVTRLSLLTLARIQRLFSPVLDSLSPRGTSGGRVGEGGFLAAPPLPDPLLHRMEERESATLNTYDVGDYNHVVADVSPRKLAGFARLLGIPHCIPHSAF